MGNNGNELTALELAKLVYDKLDDKMAQDIKVLDISSLSPIADIFIVATGNNPPHMKTLIDESVFILKEKNVLPKGLEGYQSARWILVDFGRIVLHIFSKEDREFYDMEHIWADAKEIDFA